MASMSATKLPNWYRALAVAVGIISIVLALIVLVMPLLALWLLIFFLAFALMLIGLDRLIAGITGHPFPGMLTFVPPAMAGGDQPTPSGSPPTPPKT